MGLGPSLPPIELERQDLVLFVEVKRLFSITPETKFFSKSLWVEKEANGGHRGDRTRSRHNRTRPISGSSSLARDARASHRCIRSIIGPPRSVKP
jgi:hypothetical protein